VATAAGRLTLVAILASSVVHRFPASGGWHLVSLGLGAIVLWAADWWTAPLVIAPMCRERPLQVFANIVRQGVALEGAQYLMAVPGALIVSDQPWALALFLAPTAAVYRHFKRIKELHAGTYQLLERLADTVDQRDAYTGGHSRRVAELCAAILKALPLDGPEAEMIVAAARVHDIGKIDLPDHVLQKPGILTPAERALMQEHPERGAALLLNHPGFARMAQMVRHHHEACDGSGYPHGLHGPAIPFGARVIAVADSYDAMTSDRPYRRGMSPMQAVTRLLAGRDAQWDASIVDALISVLPGVADTPAALHSIPVEAGPRPLALAR
jgi:HD-GYP domain-containing protein (c-di-GMP phosphodiesterase class II)